LTKVLTPAQSSRLKTLTRRYKPKKQKVTDADVEKALIQIKSQMRKIKAKESLEVFMKTYGKEHFTSEFGSAQLELIHTLETVQNTGGRIARAEPREFGKTTIVEWFILYCILYDLKKFIIYVCDAKDQSSLVVQTIQQELEENELLIEDFGDQTAKDTWGKNELVTKSGCRLMARGAKSRMRGLKSGKNRPDLVVMDDVENDKNTMTADLRDQLWSWVRRVVLNLPSVNGDVVMVGTVLHWDSILMRIIKDDAWNSKIISALDKNGKSTWPEGWPEQRLEKKKREIGTEAFSQEFLNDPIDVESQAFKRSHLRTYKMSEKNFEQNHFTIYHHYLTWDPAWSGNKRSHYTGMMVIAVDGDNNWWVRDIYREHATETEAINMFFHLQQKYGCIRQGMETVFRQISLKDAMEDEMRKRNIFFEIEKLKSNLTDKEKRIRGLVPRWEMGTIYLPEDHPKYKHLMDELLQFPKARTDDMVDALAYCLQIATPPPRASELMQQETQTVGMVVDPETGYMQAGNYHNYLNLRDRDMAETY